MGDPAWMGGGALPTIGALWFARLSAAGRRKMRSTLIYIKGAKTAVSLE
jgi:hypothetical protein